MARKKEHPIGTPYSRYKRINELIYAARANGDYYGADGETEAEEKKVTEKIDRWITRLIENQAD